MPSKNIRPLKVVLVTVALGMAIYQLLYTQVLIQSPDAHLITHLGFALTVIFLSMIIKEKSDRKRMFIVTLLGFSLFVTGYLYIELDAILEYRTAIPTGMDLTVGALIVVVLLIGNFFVFGWTFSLVAVAAVVYLIFGRYFPYPFTVPPISFQRLLMWISVELGTGKGVYGSLLDMSATYLFLFIFFGGILEAFGATEFVINVGKWIGSKLTGGPAMVALFGSSLLGSVTGSTVANITITGSFTIPMMKKGGFTPEQAAAIETVSSNGGQIIPPIMGATAFLMAGYINVRYIEIAKAAIIPAFLYVLCVFIYIYLTSKKMNIKGKVGEVRGGDILIASPPFVIGLSVMVALLIEGYSLPFVGFWSIMGVISMGLLTQALRKDRRLSIGHTISKLVSTVESASGIAMICGLLGVIVSAVVTSGLAIKLPLAIKHLSGGCLPVALLITAMTSMILGVGMPTPAAYILVALGAVPSLTKMGVPLLAANLYCFYYAICSHITPPVAVGALVASQMASSNYWKTCWECIKAAIAKYLLPLFFVYAPVVLLEPAHGLALSVLEILAMVIVVLSGQIATANYCFTTLRFTEIVLFLAACFFSLAYVFMKDPALFGFGVTLFLIGICLQSRQRMRTRQSIW